MIRSCEKLHYLKFIAVEGTWDHRLINKVAITLTLEDILYFYLKGLWKRSCVVQVYLQWIAAPLNGSSSLVTCQEGLLNPMRTTIVVKMSFLLDQMHECLTCKLSFLHVTWDLSCHVMQCIKAEYHENDFISVLFLFWNLGKSEKASIYCLHFWKYSTMRP